MITITGLQSTWEYPFSESKNYYIGVLAAQLNISFPVAFILYNRGYETKESALQFLFPNEDSAYDPHLMHNAYPAALRIIDSINNREKILICGDYDVDGITGTSLLLLALVELGASVNFFLPHRVYDGYGLSAKVIQKAKQAQYKLVITVDNGTCAFDALKKAQELNIDVIVTDHHQPKEMPIGMLYLINPHQEECQYPFKELAGVGVAFKLITLIYSILKKKIPQKIYELYMIGTIADLVPLVNENRYWVKYALQNINKEGSLAVSLLKQNANMQENKIISSTDIAFGIAPQLNALGRLSDPRNGVLFFINQDYDQMAKISKQLYTLNEERKKTERILSEQLLLEIKNDLIHPHESGCIIKASKQFPAGIIGLIATKVNQYYAVPSCIFTENDEGILKGSCRTIPACNIFNILASIDPQIIISFGGHKAAAGVSIHKKHLSEFKKSFSSQILNQFSKEDFKNKIKIDAFLDIDDINNKFWKDLLLLEPFGASNITPLFCIQNIKVASIKVIKDKHIKILIEGQTKSIWTIFFNRIDIINQIRLNQTISIVGQITENSWQDRKNLEIIGTDITIHY